MRGGAGAFRRLRSMRSGLVRVYVSGTPGELSPFRRAAIAVCRRLGLLPILADEATSLAERREAVESCDLAVLLLGTDLGERPPGDEASYLELEYEWAVAGRRASVLPFVLATPAGGDEDLDRFLTVLRTRHGLKQTSALADFRRELLLTLALYQAEGEPRDVNAVAVPAPPAFHAVPPYVGSAPFTGRAEDLKRLDAWGRSEDPVLVVESIGGIGKSALTWEWAQQHAPEVLDGLAGRLWWSFYGGSASVTRFLQETLAYVSGQPLEQVRLLGRTELADQVLAALSKAPYLLVLDGFERLLGAFHRFDPSKLRDEDVEPGRRSMIEPHADELVRALCAVGPSKILISTRLMPEALEGRFGQRTPGVTRLRLPGLTAPDTVTLLDRLGVRGDPAAIAEFFRGLNNHPLLVGIVAGLVRDYQPEPGESERSPAESGSVVVGLVRDDQPKPEGSDSVVVGLVRDYQPEPGDFDRWLADPEAGGELVRLDLDLAQRRAYLLDAALAATPAPHRRLLGWISVLPGAVDWPTLAAINPFRPAPPPPIEPDLSALGPYPAPPSPFILGTAAEDAWAAGRAWDAEAERLRAEAADRTADERAWWASSDEVGNAGAQLDAALADLEERGLLWWDRTTAVNAYDLHPIVRAYVHDQLEDVDRVAANNRIRDHFQSAPREDPASATSVEDLRQTITLFYALVGAGHVGEASAVWARALGDPLLMNLGGAATVVELLAPLASTGSRAVRADLAIAYFLLGQYTVATAQDTSLLADALLDRDAEAVARSLGRLAVDLAASGVEVAAARCLELYAALRYADGEHDDPWLLGERGVAAIRCGRVDDGLALVDRAIARASALGVPPSVWFDGDLRYWRLYAALVSGELTEAELTEAAELVRDWRYRRRLAELRRELAIGEGRFADALEADQVLERLDRDAGRETAPATTAYLLARLDRPDEANAALASAFDRLPRLHLAARPHYRMARALLALDRRDEAVEHARLAYQQAWRDGPPASDHWALRDVRILFEELGEPEPSLRITDPDTVTVPMQNEVRAFIARVEQARAALSAR